MNPSVEPSSSPLVVFGPDQIDTSRAEMLVQCLNDKIKEKRYKLQKWITTIDEKKKRNELMKADKQQLAAKLANIEQETLVREHQLQSEQARLKELQLNIQMLDDHTNSMKRDYHNAEQKYEQEKSQLIHKFERTKQQWTDVFKPQYEQSRVYQYLKRSDLAYTVLAQRKETLLDAQKTAYQDYRMRRRQLCNEKNLQASIVSVATYSICRRDQLIKIENMKNKLMELESKHQHLLESKLDKIKAWESVYTQPMKRDLMDFCLQTNMDQVLTLSFNQLQQEMLSQPMTPILAPASTPLKDKTVFDTVRFEAAIGSEAMPSIHPDPFRESSASTITIESNTDNGQVESDRSSMSSVLHLTTAIDDDDDELFSASRRKLPTALLEKMSINDRIPSTQAFVVTTSPHTTDGTDDNASPDHDQSLTQGFAVPEPPAAIQSTVESDAECEIVTPVPTAKVPDSVSNPSSDTNVHKSHLNVTFQLGPPRMPSRSVHSAASSIQPQVTSTDIQQMLLTFSSGPSSNHDEEPQPMEDDAPEQSQQLEQQQPVFSIASSMESSTSIESEFTGFNYNFGFEGDASHEAGAGTAGRGFTSPISFGNWGNLSSPIPTSSNEPFSAFLQQTSSPDSGVANAFSFSSFNYGDLGGAEVSTDGAFGSFFFASNDNPADKEQGQ